MQKRWILRESPNPEIVKKLCSEINVSTPIAAILSQRKINDFDTAKAFFRPSLNDLHNPFLMKDMDEAIARLNNAVKSGEKILIYGDYDVDGTCSVALLYTFLKGFYQHIDFYVPDRYSEGYGISEKGIEFAAKEGFSLIVALDCGIRAIDQIALANSFGIDVVVCDHHNPAERIPAAKAILNPKQKDCDYPYKELTGCAIGFKLVQAYAEKYHIDQKQVFSLLDFAAVSIACDIVPITGENRILAKYGLKLLNTQPRAGFKALKDVASLPESMNVTNLVFGIGPRINAAGRIKHAKQAVELLITKEEERAIKIAKEVQINNDTRKTYDEQITLEALSMIEEKNLKEWYSTVLFKQDWHKGVIGIVASRCIEKYYRPTIIITESNGKATGSARSVKGFDIHEAITACAEHLEQFGGHKYAAGLTLAINQVPLFAEKFEEIVKSNIPADLLIPKIEIDACIELSQITWKFFNVIEQMAPFGPENRRPVFMAKVICKKDRMRILKEKHLKMSVSQIGIDFSIDAIAFNFSDISQKIQHDVPFYLCFTIEKNEFRGKTTLQLMIKDIKTELDKEEAHLLQNRNSFLFSEEKDAE